MKALCAVCAESKPGLRVCDDCAAADRERAKAEEREACASEIDEMVEHGIPHAEFARRLRARGEVKPANDPPTHRCKVCGALWWLGDVPPVGMSWSLRSPSCGKCCDNVAMGDQIEPLAGEAKTTEQHPECSICRRRHGREVEHACE